MKTGDFYFLAKREKDEGEMTGTGANPRIVQYLESTTLSPSLSTTDETPWCSAFVNWIVEKSGMKGTNRADAVSWLNWGEPTDKPVKGSIVVFQWPDGGHHVGFVSDFPAPGKVNVLGGNQGNKVKISAFSTASVMGYRNPVRNFFSWWVFGLGIASILGTVAAVTGIFTGKKGKK